MVFTPVCRVFGLKQSFYAGDGQSERNPVPRCAFPEASLVNTVIREPLMDMLQGLISWFDQAVDFGDGEVSSIASVGRVGDLSVMNEKIRIPLCHSSQHKDADSQKGSPS